MRRATTVLATLLSAAILGCSSGEDLVPTTGTATGQSTPVASSAIEPTLDPDVPAAPAPPVDAPAEPAPQPSPTVELSRDERVCTLYLDVPPEGRGMGSPELAAFVGDLADQAESDDLREALLDEAEQWADDADPVTSDVTSVCTQVLGPAS